MIENKCNYQYIAFIDYLQNSLILDLVINKRKKKKKKKLITFMSFCLDYRYPHDIVILFIEVKKNMNMQLSLL